ncbi:hypothetical protein SIID45300_00734 [Candidatus Magnetaquicoccaceae bacterium FCR-1]|uniref:DUF58 domain-containing protein n=1 Tax=Candidatus Magnetaquiglobus chichijimensis TaxID=3141448 RepID=A0ABQ0C6D4_9PROT
MTPPVIDIDELLALRHAAHAVPSAARRHAASATGEHRAPFKGRGMEFAETRLYQAGDEVRHMEWRVTARTGKPHVKLFREERERALLLWIDCRRPMFHATRGREKIVQAARAATYAAWSAVGRGDRIGALLFSEQNHAELRPARGDRAVIGLIRALHRFGQPETTPCDTNAPHRFGQPETTPCDTNAPHRFGQPETTPPPDTSALALPLARLERVALPGSLVLLCSDFRGLRDSDHARLAQLARRHDVTLFFPHAPLERTLPPAGGRYPIAAPGHASQRFLMVDDPEIRQAHAARFAARHDGLRDLCQRIGAGFLSVSTEEEATSGLMARLHGRAA